MTRAVRTARRQSEGQATVEFVVLAVALVPLLLLVPLMGKYLDLMQSAEVASRYVAFEATVHHARSGWKPADALAEEVRHRFFSASHLGLRSGDVARDEAPSRNPVWRDHGGRPLIHDFGAQVGVQGRAERSNALSVNEQWWDSELRLPDHSLYRGEVSVRPRNVPGLTPFDAIDLVTTRRTTVLVDTWAAADPGEVRRRITGSLLLYPFADLGPAETLVSQFPRAVGDDEFHPGLHDWEVVPCDRLEGGCR